MDTSTRGTERHFQYVAEHTAPEDEFLKGLKRAAAVAGIPSSWTAPEPESLIQILSQLFRAREVVEIGTLPGSSRIVIDSTRPESGRVAPIEPEAYAAGLHE